MAQQTEAVPAQCIGRIQRMVHSDFEGVVRAQWQVYAATVSRQIKCNQFDVAKIRGQRHEAGGIVQPTMQSQHFGCACAPAAQCMQSTERDVQDGFFESDAHASVLAAMPASAATCDGASLRQGM